MAGHGVWYKTRGLSGAGQGLVRGYGIRPEVCQGLVRGYKTRGLSGAGQGVRYKTTGLSGSGQEVWV